MYPWKYGKNPSTGAQDTVQTRKCHAKANGICTKLSMSPSPYVVDIITAKLLHLKYTQCQLNPFSQADQNRYLCKQCSTSRLIWIYTVCHSVFGFTLNPPFASEDMPKLKDVKSPFLKLRDVRVEFSAILRANILYDIRPHKKKELLSLLEAGVLLIIEDLITTTADDRCTLKFFRENKAWHFM